MQVRGLKSEAVITALPPRQAHAHDGYGRKSSELLSAWETSTVYAPLGLKDAKEIAKNIGAYDAVIAQNGNVFEFTVSQMISVSEFIETLSVEERKGLAAALIQAPISDWETRLNALNLLPPPDPNASARAARYYSWRQPPLQHKQ